jgi:hypothetical protein
MAAIDPSKLDPDAAAAHKFLSELRTRITTQPLPYQYGSESRALESLWEVFGQAREAMKTNPGCVKFSTAVTHLLNMHLRPVTAKWDRAHFDGRLDSRDGADEFRADLADLQLKLREFAVDMQVMAYGAATPDELTPPAMAADDLREICADVEFGLDKGLSIPEGIVKDINRDERDEVYARRDAHGIATSKGVNASGLALSGGGIRSATFCLGVVQVLADRGLLKDVDFLSTVSGGGYTGSFLTARLGAGGSQQDVAGPYGPDPDPIRYLRHHAKYLAAVDLKEGWTLATATLAGMLLNWSAPVLIIVLAALAARLVSAAIPNAGLWPIALSVSALLTLISLVAFGALMRQKRKVAVFGGSMLALLMALTVLIGVGWLLTVCYGRWEGWVRAPHDWGLSGIIATVIVAAPTILRFVPIFKTPAFRRIALKVMLLVAGIAVPLLCLVLFFFALYASVPNQPMTARLPWWDPFRYSNGMGVLAMLALVLTGVAVFILNINLTGPHRFYRDRLAAAFVKKSDDDEDSVALEKLNPTGRAPYHLVNTTVNLPSSNNSSLRDRKADFFLFSKHWCGSPVVGYAPTSAWKMNAAKPDLATAMAVSGAAASSHMGLGAMPTLVALLTFLNVRLGFWIRRPGYNHFPQVPGFTCLMREMTGIGMSEKRAWLNLSDGGHIENMGAYELLRRRCKYIICVDGEADPAFTFHGFMTLKRHAQLDFGVRIEPRLDVIRPDAESTHSQAHATLCRIHYPAAADGRPAATGLFLYLKLSVTGNESELIRRYRTICPDFPHQSTLDQFFGEEQFEAYRELGVHVAEGLFSYALMNGAPSPASIPEWFRKLAGNLLETGVP